MNEYRTATLEEYRCLHPDDDYVPPLVTDDGDVAAIGTAHGRTIPVVGSTRPPVYDVSLHPLDGGKTRIYADDPDDVLAMVCGEDYQQQLMLCRDLITEYNELGDGEDTAEQRRDLRAAFDAESTFLGMIRGAFGHVARASAQARVNTTAKENGLWEQLTAQEQQILTDAADPNSQKAPIGVVGEAQFPDPDNPGMLFTGTRGYWTADVDLVLNEADYYPWTPIPGPLSEVTITDDDGNRFVDNTSDLNLKYIRVATAQDMLDDLEALDVITMKMRPVVPVDPIYREVYEEAVSKRVAHNRAEAESAK